MDEIGGVCRKNIICILLRGGLKGRYSMGYLAVNGRIKLEWILHKYGGSMWTG
jgi:hypothetical protein